jgi:hypothetical protein
MLRIIPSSEPIHVERLNVCIYAPPGLGKTTLAFTSDKPLLLDFDHGAHRAPNRKTIAKIESWQDVADITRDDVADFNTIVMDTAGRGLDLLAMDIIRRNAKMGYAGALNLKGFGMLKGEFRSFANMLNGFGKDVVLIAHMDEQRSGDELIERLDVQGSSKGEIYKTADVMGRLSMREGKRVLSFSPSDTAFGKNPAMLPEFIVPTHIEDPRFLAGVIEQVKAHLNTLTEEQMVAQALQAAWRTRIDEAATPEAFNALLPEVKEQPRVIAAMLNHTAKRRGYRFADGAYTAPAAATA